MDAHKNSESEVTYAPNIAWMLHEHICPVNPSCILRQEFHYQSRCIRMVEHYEQSAARGGRTYERVMFTRLEFEWLHDHPPLSLLDPRYLWVPTGEDNTGLNDRHWLANRHDAAVSPASLNAPPCMHLAACMHLLACTSLHAPVRWWSVHIEPTGWWAGVARALLLTSSAECTSVPTSDLARPHAQGVFRRWDALINGRFHAIFFATTQVRSPSEDHICRSHLRTWHSINGVLVTAGSPRIHVVGNLQ